MLQPIIHILNAQKIVLASGSPRRKQILENVGLKFEVIPSTFEETLDKSKFPNPVEYVLETATQKTLQVATTVQTTESISTPNLVIGADTVVSMNGKIFEKPRDKDDAYQMLTGFSGKNHVVYTGVVFITPSPSCFKGAGDCIDGMRIHKFHESTEVTMAQLTPEIISAYIETGEPMDKAGGYGIQAIGGTLVEKIHGDFFNVMGFPLCRFSQELLKLYSSILTTK